MTEALSCKSLEFACSLPQSWRKPVTVFKIPFSLAQQNTSTSLMNVLTYSAFTEGRDLLQGWSNAAHALEWYLIT